jgi:hypothetical protein
MIKHSQNKDQFLKVAIKQMQETQTFKDELKATIELNSIRLAQIEELETKLANELQSKETWNQIDQWNQRADGFCCCPINYAVEGSPTGRSRDLDNPIKSNVFRNRMFRELPPLTRTRLSLTSFMMGLTIRGYRPSFDTKSGWSLQLKVMGNLWPFKVLGGGGWDRYDLPGYEFLLPHWLIWLGITIDVVNLFMSLGEVTLGTLWLFLLINPFGHLENLICKMLESVAVPGLVLSLGVENAHAMQEAFKFTRPRLVLLMASWPFHHIDKMVSFPLLVVALGWARLVRVARLLLLLLFSGVEGHLLSQGILVSHSEHLFWCPRILHGELMDQGRVSESLLEEHDNWLVINLHDNVSFVVKPLDKLLEGLPFLLDDAG